MSRAEQLARLVEVVLWTVLLGASLVAVLAFVLGAHRSAALAAGTAAFYAVLLWRRRRMPSQLTGGLASLAFLAAATWAMCLGYGLHDLGIMLMPLVLVVGSMVLDRTYFVALVLLALVATVGVGVAEWYGWLENSVPDLMDATDLVVGPVVLAAAAVLIRVLVDNLYRSLAAAEAHHRRYREIFNATHEAIFVHDGATGAILDVNKPMLDLYGMTREEALSSTVGQLTAEGDSLSQHKAVRLIERAAREGPQIFEWRARRKDGSLFWAEVTLRASTIEGSRRVLAVVRDVEQRKHRQEHLRQLEKMEAVGQLAGGVAHDFNNQLTGIIGFSELLATIRKDDPLVVDHAQGILRAASHAADLTEKLLAFARKGRSMSELVDVHALVREVVTILGRSIDRRVSVRTELEAQSATVLGDPSQLANALLNLGLNARDAMPNGGQLLFRTDVVPDDSEELESSEVRKTARALRIDVIDTGIGMDDTTQARAFEPFFTTKDAGTGMGLAAVYGTVQTHGGQIEVSSAPGRGTRFRLQFPLAQQGADGPVDSKEGPHQPGKPLRILLIEDEPTVADACTLLLQELGHTVVHCPDGQAGVDAYRERQASVDMVLMDLTTPRLSPDEVVATLRRINEEALIVLYSGYDAGDRTRRLLDAGAYDFLRKPFRLEELERLLARVSARLDGRRSHPAAEASNE